MSSHYLCDDVWEYNAPQFVDFAVVDDDPDADAWFGKVEAEMTAFWSVYDNHISLSCIYI
jgi:hypothetical protein